MLQLGVAEGLVGLTQVFLFLVTSQRGRTHERPSHAEVISTRGGRATCSGRGKTLTSTHVEREKSTHIKREAKD